MPPRQPPQLASSILFMVVLWFLISVESPNNYLSLTKSLSQRFERHQAALDHLNASAWGDFSPAQSDSPTGLEPSYLNLTGFREEDGLAWDDLSRFRKQCQDWYHRFNPPIPGSREGLSHIDQDAVWQNATGFVKGLWTRKNATSERKESDYNLTVIAPDYTWRTYSHIWSRNITGGEGKIALDMIDTGRNIQQLDYDALPDEPATAGGQVRTAKASLEIEDVEGSGVTWEMRMHGVQWPRVGAILLTTTSEKFDGIFALPHLSPGPDFFQSSQKLLNETLESVIEKEMSSSLFNDVPIPWSSDPNRFEQDSLSPSKNCEYILFAQVHPPDRAQLNMNGYKAELESMPDIISSIEQELRFPNGAPIRGIPDLQMSAILWSPDCAFFLETKGPPEYPAADGRHLVGNKIEVIYGQIRFWVLTYAAAFGAQVLLLKDQMRESPTPSTLCRVSYSSISMMVILDGLTFAAASMWSLDAGITFLESFALLFAAFLSMAIGGIFLAEIHKVQEPLDRRERESSSRNTPRPAATPRNQEEQSQEEQSQAVPAQAVPGSLPTEPEAAPTARPPSPPIIIPSDQDIDAEIAESELASNNANTNTNTTAANPRREVTTRGLIVARLATIISLMLVLSIFSTTWSSRFRAMFVNALALVYLSFWVPQIHRNTMRNCRRALSWRFMIGQSVLRLAPLAYFYLREDNFLLAEPDRRMFLVFCGWLWVQLWILAFQDILGPRFGIPKSWTPEAWDYHPILREDNLEDGSFPIGLLSSLEPVHTGPTKRDGQDGEREAEEQDDDDDDKHKEKDPRSGTTKGGSSGAGAGGPGAHAGVGSGMRSARTECAICFDVLEVPVVRAGEADTAAGGVAGVLTRRNYMVTPCRHVFHSPCLESWLRYRLKCPICRDDLPPL